MTPAGAGELTTVTRLVADLSLTTDDVGGVLGALIDAGAARLTRTEHGRTVNVGADHIAAHARFRIHLDPPVSVPSGWKWHRCRRLSCGGATSARTRSG